MYQRRLFPLFMIPLLLFSLSACVTDPMSWSPDGRYLTFIGMNDQRLWLWDSHSDESRMLVDAQIVGCRFLPNNHEIIYGVEDDKEANLFKFDIQSGQSTLLMEKVSYYFDLSPDGNDLFYMKANSSQNSTDLYRYDLSLNQETLLLSLDGTAIQCIDVDPSGKRFLLTLDEHTLALWEAGQKDIQTLGTKSDRNLLFPQWFDDDHYLYFDTDGAHDIGNLIFDSITNPSPVILCEEVLIWDLPSFSSDRKSLYVTQQVDQNLNQIVQIDLATHEKKVMIQNPLGAGWATLHPSKNQVAYISETFDDNSSSLLHIQDMKTEHDHIVWRDEEESKVATAESLRQSGEYPLAIRIYQDILAQYPNSRFTNLAWFKMLQMYLAPPFVNIDQAFEALNHMSQPSPQAQSMFWKETDRSATDPAEDWIARFCTAEAQTQYEFNTDLTRDLLGLSVKLSDQIGRASCRERV